MLLRALLACRIVTIAAYSNNPGRPEVAPSSEGIVQLPFGSVRGNLNEGAREFLGIPFATAKRFEAPEQWSQQYEQAVLDATSFSAQCPQLYPSGSLESEDCLALNIFTPRHQHTDDALPVLL